MAEWIASIAASLVPMLGRALLAFLWQGALIGLLAALALHLLRDARAQVRYAVACLALLACVLLPLSSIALQWLALAQATLPTPLAPLHSDVAVDMSAASAARMAARLRGILPAGRFALGRGRERAVAAHGAGPGVDPRIARDAARPRPTGLAGATGCVVADVRIDAARGVAPGRRPRFAGVDRLLAPGRAAARRARSRACRSNWWKHCSRTNSPTCAATITW